MSKNNLQPHEIYQRKDVLGIKNSKDMLVEIIETNKDNLVRQKAIKYIGVIGNDIPSLQEECFKKLENLIVSEENIEIKTSATKALGKLNYEKGLKPLKWLLKQEDLNYNVKFSALKAIGKIRFEEPEIQIFINELDNNFSSMKEFVKTQLITLAPGKLIILLIKSLKNEALSDEHKIEILKLMGYEIATINISFEDLSYIKTKYPEIVEDLVRNEKILLEAITLVLKQDDSALMDSVLSILKILGSQINRDIINLLLGDDFIVKKNAIILAGKLRLAEAADVLTLNLDNIYNEVSIASIVALGEIGDISAVSDLLSILNIEDISYEYTDLDMKFYVLDAVKKIYLNNIKASYEDLYTYLTSENDTIKESIAFLFGEIGKSEFIKPLIDLLKTRNLDVKKNAIIALGKIGNVESLENLISIVKDSKIYWLIKKVAADAIYNIYQKNWYKIKDKEGELKRTLMKDMAHLIEHLNNEEDENYKVKLSLIKFLEVFGEDLALNALLKRVNDFHRIVRIHASNAIKKIEERLELENNS